MGALTEEEKKMLAYAERYLRESPDFATGFKLIALVRRLAGRVEEVEGALTTALGSMRGCKGNHDHGISWARAALRAPTAPREAASIADYICGGFVTRCDAHLCAECGTDHAPTDLPTGEEEPRAPEMSRAGKWSPPTNSPQTRGRSARSAADLLSGSRFTATRGFT